jgi:DNA replication protein DnaC
VGKSHLAQALGHEACRRGYEILFLPASRMLAQLASGRADGTYERKLSALTRPHLLILDDFGLKPLKSPGPEDFYDVISERYEKGSTIITSNRAFAEWADLCGEPLLASTKRTGGRFPETLGVPLPLGDLHRPSWEERNFHALRWEPFRAFGASAALDRLAHDAHQFVLTGESYRTRPTRRRTAEKWAGNEGQEVVP